MLKTDNIGIALYNEYLTAVDSGDLNLAMKFLRKSVRAGEIMAKHALAYHLQNTHPKAYRRILTLYREAAKGGFSPSAVNLARYYEKTGRKSDYFRWLKRAAELGDNEAFEEISKPAPYMFENGIDSIEAGSIDEGMSLIHKAASWGNVDARRTLQQLQKQNRTKRLLR